MSQQNVKITHVLNDSGIFTSWVKQLFDQNGIENRFVIINPSGKNEWNTDGDFHANMGGQGMKMVEGMINESDVVIHYFLSYSKSSLILKSNPTVRHFWYFYGADIYQQLNLFRKKLYGTETKKWMRFSVMNRYRLELRAIKHTIFNFRRSPKMNLLKSFSRIEKILWYVDEEINWINSKIKTPEFEYFKFFSFERIFPFDTSKLEKSKQNILIGNSAALENNHLDVLKIFKDGNLSNCHIQMPLSYGKPLNYKKAIIKKYSAYFGDNVHFLDKVVPLDEYYSWLNSCPTAIMGHYRQQGLGNIFYLVANGTKVYLSKNNILLKWFKQNDLALFCLEDDFVKDAQSNNLILSDELRVKNFIQLKSVLQKESTFIKGLLK